MDRFTLLKNMFLMVVADRSVARQELELLSERCIKWGYSVDEFRAALDYAFSPEAELTIPPKRSDRRELLEELLRVMAADGQLADSEKELFAVAAAHMNFSDQEVDALIDQVVGDQS